LDLEDAIVDDSVLSKFDEYDNQVRKYITNYEVLLLGNQDLKKRLSDAK